MMTDQSTSMKISGVKNHWSTSCATSYGGGGGGLKRNYHGVWTLFLDICWST